MKPKPNLEAMTSASLALTYESSSSVINSDGGWMPETVQAARELLSGVVAEFDRRDAELARLRAELAALRPLAEAAMNCYTNDSDAYRDDAVVEAALAWAIKTTAARKT